MASLTKAGHLRSASILTDHIADEKKNLNRLMASARSAKSDASKRLYQGWAKESREKIADFQKWKRYHLAEAKKIKT